MNQFRRVRPSRGNDLIAMGLSPVYFQRILKGLREAVPDGQVHSLERNETI